MTRAAQYQRFAGCAKGNAARGAACRVVASLLFSTEDIKQGVRAYKGHGQPGAAWGAQYPIRGMSGLLGPRPNNLAGMRASRPAPSSPIQTSSACWAVGATKHARSNPAGGADTRPVAAL